MQYSSKTLKDLNNIKVKLKFHLTHAAEFLIQLLFKYNLHIGLTHQKLVKRW